MLESGVRAVFVWKSAKTRVVRRDRVRQQPARRSGQRLGPRAAPPAVAWSTCERVTRWSWNCREYFPRSCQRPAVFAPRGGVEGGGELRGPPGDRGEVVGQRFPVRLRGVVRGAGVVHRGVSCGGRGLRGQRIRLRAPRWRAARVGSRQRGTPVGGVGGRGDFVRPTAPSLAGGVRRGFLIGAVGKASGRAGGGRGGTPVAEGAGRTHAHRPHGPRPDPPPSAPPASPSSSAPPSAPPRLSAPSRFFGRSPGFLGPARSPGSRPPRGRWRRGWRGPGAAGGRRWGTSSPAGRTRSRRQANRRVSTAVKRRGRGPRHAAVPAGAVRGDDSGRRRRAGDGEPVGLGDPVGAPQIVAAGRVAVVAAALAGAGGGRAERPGRAAGDPHERRAPNSPPRTACCGSRTSPFGCPRGEAVGRVAGSATLPYADPGEATANLSVAGLPLRFAVGPVRPREPSGGGAAGPETRPRRPGRPARRPGRLDGDQRAADRRVPGRGSGR